MTIILTAVVGVLNKQAVAIAADSAVTIGGSNGRKILNKANKVFTLSKFHPVGILIYNSAAFMGTPWETIIKVYRKQLKDQAFPTVEEYATDFINFLKSNAFYTDDETQKRHLHYFLSALFRGLINEIHKENPLLLEERNQASLTLFLNALTAKSDKIADFLNDKNSWCDEFDDYPLASFLEYSNDVIANVLKEQFADYGIALTTDAVDKFKHLSYLLLKSKENHWSFTGLIFVGFGEIEIYPQLIPYNISLAVDNRLRYYVEEENSAHITNKNTAAIMPFAQTDVIDTILSGVDPSLDNIYLNNFRKSFVKYNNEILKIIGDTNPSLSAQIKALNIEELTKVYAESNHRIKATKYIRPLMNAVGTLSKEDLAEMAESLIYLTYLKRRITFAEESVGGPVDVAIISKGDGFIWIKRKHYFEPELNNHFFKNYFNF